MAPQKYLFDHPLEMLFKIVFIFEKRPTILVYQFSHVDLIA